MNQPRIVTWRAVSTEDQAEKESLKYQKKLNDEHVARWGGIVIDELEVPGVSRSIILWDDACNTIEAYEKLDRLISRKAFDILMCMDITRLGRTSALVATLAALCERAGIRIYETSSPPASVDGPIGTSDSRLLLLFKGYQSEQEIKKFTERAHFGKIAIAKKGRHIGGTRPSGLKLVYDEHGTPHNVVDEVWRPLILLFYDLYLKQGRSLNDIYREFNARGILIPGTTRQWTHDSIRIFLRNRWTHAGYVTYGTYSEPEEKRFRAQAEWQPIVTEEDVRALEQEMARRTQHPRATYGPHRFSLVAKCATCGSTMTAHSVVELKNGLVENYACRLRCKRTNVKEAVIYEAIRDTIISLANDALLEELVGETPQGYTNLQCLLEEKKKALELVRKERTKLTQAFMRDTIELEEYEPLMAELKARHDDIAANLTQLEDQLASTPNAEQRRTSLEEICNKGLEMLDHPDVALSCAFLRRHFVVYIQGKTVVSVTVM